MNVDLSMRELDMIDEALYCLKSSKEDEIASGQNDLEDIKAILKKLTEIAEEHERRNDDKCGM